MTNHPVPLPDSVAGAAHGRGDSAALRPRHLPDLTRLRRATSDQAAVRNELAWLLVLDNLIDAGEVETYWLDQIETRLTRQATYAPKARARDTAASHIDRSTESSPR
jgi:hypothetical protein